MRVLWSLSLGKAAADYMQQVMKILGVTPSLACRLLSRRLSCQPIGCTTQSLRKRLTILGMMIDKMSNEPMTTN